ncbi:MAG: translation initiation factor IF-2 [Bacteroides sp.]|nr:translation initiation factor IF-2 [Bacteroides sp.]
MSNKISKVAKDLNVGVSTVVEFLQRHDITVDNNPNARIDDRAVDLLMSGFSSDKDAKQKADDRIKTRAEVKKARNDRYTGDISTSSATPVPGLKVLGKIDLGDSRRGKSRPSRNEGKSSHSQSRQQSFQDRKENGRQGEAAGREVKGDRRQEQNKNRDSRQESRQAASKPAPQKAPQQQKPSEQQKTMEHQKPVVSQKSVEQPKPAVQPATIPQPETPTPASTEAPKSNVFRLGTPPAAPELKVLGKIDLSSLNQSTRPKKRGRDERRRGGDKNRQGGNAVATGDNNSENTDRKKRKRIGKEKIDIEKAASQPGFGSDGKKKKGGDKPPRGNNGNPQQGGGGNAERKRGDRKGGTDRKGGDRKGNDRQQRQEPNQEDVQKQVKETLARLTNKAPKKGVKWRKEKKEAIHNRELENQRREEAESKVIQLTEFVTANDLANLMEVPVNNVIATCMNLGVMVSINQRLDAETINIVAEEFGFTTEYVSADVTEAIASEEDDEEDLVPRPPIVTVMGHVDHGKTSLLDHIRNANVIAGEAGGITQHIGAYNVKLADGRHITFLDTPGHEAFTAMRARGAKITDLAIIIVAADDDVMPQTIEAINHASAAGVPMVFAINKIDKPTANPDKIKEQLAAMNYLVEEWGGKYQSQDISAKKGIGVEDLMEKVLLEAELLDLKANPNRLAVGSIIESSLDKGRGYVATVLVQNGTLKVGDVILAGTHYGKIKAMFNERNQKVTEAGPATPVLVLGLNGAPAAGDAFNVLETEQEAREIAAKREQLQRELGLRTKKRPGLEELGRRRALNDFHELNLVVKGDVDGSVEALSDSLIKLSTEEIQVNVLHKGVGAISESDVTLAAASDAIIIGFQVRPSGAARKEAEKEGVEIRLYSVIYKAIEEVKDAMEGLLSPEIKEEITGTAEVLQTYHISKVGTIAGAIVRDGKIKSRSKVRVIRDGIVIYTGELGSLKRFKDDVKEVVSGYDCGLSVQGYNDIREGDLIEAYEEVEVKKSL